MLCFQAFCQISFSDQTAAGCLLPALSLSNSVDFQEIKRESENRRRANRRTTRPLFRTPFKYLLTLTESLLRIWRLNMRHVNCSSSVFLSAGWGWLCFCPRGVRYVKVNSDNIVTFHSSSALCLVFLQQAGELKNLSWGEKIENEDVSWSFSDSNSSSVIWICPADQIHQFSDCLLHTKRHYLVF